MKIIQSVVRPLLRFSLLVLALGCAEDEAQSGEPGGPCLVGREPCVTGYGCVNGLCAVVEADAGVDTYRAEINFPEARVAADGVAVEFDVLITTLPLGGERRAYDPETDGRLFLTPIPPEAGRVEPARPILVEGLAIADFVPCDRAADPLCPESAVIRVARDDAPLEGIGESDRFLLVDPTPTNPDMGVDSGM